MRFLTPKVWLMLASGFFISGCALIPAPTLEQAKREKAANDAGANGIFKDFEYDNDGQVRPYPPGPVAK